MQIDNPHFVQVGELPGTLARIEFELVGEKLDGLAVSMAKQCQVVFVIQIPVKIPWVVNYQNGAITPHHLKRRLGEMETMQRGALFQRALVHIVISIDSE